MNMIERADRALGVLQGKWKVHLLFFMARGIRRHSRLLECLPGASKKMMIETLRALERDGLVVRRVFAEVPVRVEYSLTPLGWTITEPLIALSEWGEAYGDEVTASRLSHRASAAEALATPPLAEARQLAERRLSDAAACRTDSSFSASS
jgi:DNA-binding HxlR family transcriptional regulator